MQTIPNFYIQQSAYSPIHLKLGLPASFDYAHTHSSSLAQIIWSILYYEDELRNYIVTIKKYQISWEKYFGRNIFFSSSVSKFLSPIILQPIFLYILLHKVYLSSSLTNLSQKTRKLS